MKTKLLTLLLTVFGLISYAQNERHVAFGPKVGFNFGATVPHGPNPSIDSTSGSPIVGENLGIFYIIHLNPKWSVWVEGSFSRKAVEHSARATDLYYLDEQCIQLPNGTITCGEIETIFNGTTWGTFNNLYFEIPVFARYSFNENWHILGGAYYAIRQSSASKVNYDGFVGASTLPTVDERDLSDKMNLIDYGVSLGTQFQVKPLLIDFRLTYGLNSIVKSDYEPIDYPIQNVFAQFSLCYQFFRYPLGNTDD